MDDVNKRLDRLELRIAKLEDSLSAPSSTNATKAKKLSPKEFLLMNHTDSATHRILLLAYFSEAYNKEELFNTTDLANLLRVAKERKPANINDLVNCNIKKGFIMEANKKKDDKKAWNLTSTGERYVKSIIEKGQ